MVPPSSLVFCLWLFIDLKDYIYIYKYMFIDILYIYVYRYKRCLFLSNMILLPLLLARYSAGQALPLMLCQTGSPSDALPGRLSIEVFI